MEITTVNPFVFNAILKEEYCVITPGGNQRYIFPLKDNTLKQVTQKQISSYFIDKADLEAVFDLSVFRSWWWQDELSAAITEQHAVNARHFRDFAEGDVVTRKNTFYTEDDLIEFGRYLTQQPVTYQDVYLWKKERGRL